MEERNHKENELISWRNNLIKTQIEDNKIYIHPVCIKYGANTDGEVFNLSYKNRPLKGSHTTDDKRMKISINNKKYQKHRFIMECLYNTKIPAEYDVDHIDRNPNNNKFKNLQILTRIEHSQKTADTNPDRGKKAGIKQSKPIKYIKRNRDGIIEKEEIFESQTDAARKLGIDKSHMRKLIRTKKANRAGETFEEILDDSSKPVLGEEFKQVPGLTGLFVSNYGRCKNGTHIMEGFLIDGSEFIKYQRVCFMRKQYLVHTLVLLAFVGPAPSKEHTVDHIDRNSLNNKLSNLRWATKEEQMLNRSVSRPLQVYNIYTGANIACFKTHNELAETYGIQRSCVSRILSLSCYKLSNKHKELSIRFGDLTLEEKKQRDFTILNHELSILNIDKNKRKNNKDLPIHIIKNQSGSGFRLNITFRGKSLKCGNKDIDVLIKRKEEWIKEQQEYYMNIINNYK